MSVIGIKHKAVEILSKSGLLSKKDDKIWSVLNGPTLERVEIEKACLNVSSTNNVIELWVGRDKWFLRLCDKNEPLSALLETLIYKYETLTSQNLPEAIKKQIRGHIHKFANMGYMDDFDSPVYNFFKTGDYERLGITLNGDDDYLKSEQFKGFVHYVWSELASNRRNASGGEWQCFNLNRCRSQELIYSLLGVGRLICKTVPAKVKIGAHLCYGYLMKEAKGLNPVSSGNLNKYDINTDSLKKDLNILNILDVLCYERDHRPGNYNVVVNEENEVVSLQAFDNDSDFAFFPTSTIKKSFVGSSPLIGGAGIIARDVLDSEFLHGFLSLTNGQIRSTLSPYLNKLQIYYLKIRLAKLQKAIRRTLEIGNAGIYTGKDYYTVLKDWRESEKDPILLEQQQFKKMEINKNVLEIWTTNNMKWGG